MLNCGVRRGLIMGLWNSHTSVGNILGSLIAGYYVSSNWGLSFIVPGVIIAVMGVICFFFLIERKWICLLSYLFVHMYLGEKLSQSASQSGWWVLMRMLLYLQTLMIWRSPVHRAQLKANRLVHHLFSFISSHIGLQEYNECILYCEIWVSKLLLLFCKIDNYTL